jgi:hypothetical protein
VGGSLSGNTYVVSNANTVTPGATS